MNDVEKTLASIPQASMLAYILRISHRGMFYVDAHNLSLKYDFPVFVTRTRTADPYSYLRNYAHVLRTLAKFGDDKGIVKYAAVATPLVTEEGFQVLLKQAHETAAEIEVCLDADNVAGAFDGVRLWAREIFLFLDIHLGDEAVANTVREFVKKK